MTDGGKERLEKLYDNFKSSKDFKREVFGIPKDRWVSDVQHDISKADAVYQRLRASGDIPQEIPFESFLGRIDHASVRPQPIPAAVKPVGVLVNGTNAVPSIGREALTQALEPQKEPLVQPQKPTLWEQAKTKATGFGNQVMDLGRNIKTKIDAGLANVAAAIPTGNPDQDFLYRKQIDQATYNTIKEADKKFEQATRKNNIETSVIDAIKEGNWNRVPEAVGYNIAQAAIQIPATIATGGASMWLQTLPDAYVHGVDAVAKETGLTPEEVISSGQDAKVVAALSTNLQTLLENVGAGFVSKGIATKGGYKAVRDYVLARTGSKALARAGGLGFSAAGEAVTEADQALTDITAQDVARSKNASQFYATHAYSVGCNKRRI